MINAFRINESVANEMSRIGVRGKPVVESEKPADEKTPQVEIPYKAGHYQFTFKTSKGKDAKWVRRVYKGKDMSALHDKAKADALKEYPESHGHVMHSPQTDESITESEEVDDKKPADDKTHDEAAETKEDPTREKLETPEDEKDEKKGGPAELAADLRVSVRIEKMNVGRYKRMITKHTLSADDEKWLKGRIEQIEGEIKIMSDKIPELEKEAEGSKSKSEIKEMFIAGIKKAIVEMAAG